MQLSPSNRSLLSGFLYVFGVAILVFSLWQYANRQLLPPLRAAAATGSEYGMLQGFGGPLTGNDFLHIYLGSRLLWHGFDPYSAENMLKAGEMLIGRGPNPYVYLPFTGFVMRPISNLSYGNAFKSWFLISHLFILCAIPISLLALQLPFSLRNLIFALLVLAISFPLYRNFSAGQLNAPLVFGYAAFYLMLRRVHPAFTGALAASMMLFKITPGILLIYLLWMRMWREAAWMLGWALAFTCVTIALFGLDTHLNFLPMLRDMGYGRSTWADLGHVFFSDPANQSLNSLFHHLFAQTPQTLRPMLDLGPSAANVFTWLAALALLAIVLWRTREQRRASEKEPLSFSLFIFLSLLIPSLMWDHYLVQLFFPILALYGALHSRGMWALRAVFVAGIVIISIPFRFDAEPWKSGAGLLMMSFKLWGTLLLFSVNVLLFVRQPVEKP